MKKKELQDAWTSLSIFIKTKCTFDIGTLYLMCDLVEDDQDTDRINQFSDTVIEFINQISNLGRKKPQFEGEYLALMTIDSIIFNLYARNKNTDKLRLNNSFYNSMSMSQMSVDLSEQMSVIGEREVDLKKIVALVQCLASNQQFFKKLKLFYDRNHHKQMNHHYLQNLLQTLDYILNKQKVSKQKFNENKKQFSTFIHKKQHNQIDIQNINNTIFSNQLNKIVYFLTQAPENVYFALHRIYFVGRKRQERKHFRKINFQANDMIYNLNKCYIESFTSKIQVFQQSKNPLYKLIKSYFVCFFVPVFRKFGQIVLDFSKNDYESALHFYKSNQVYLQKYLCFFIDSLPLELIEYLNSLYKIIDRHYKAQINMSSTIPIKKLFLYSFLVDPSLVKELITNVDLQIFQEICNYILNLFFTSSVKKYSSNNTNNNNQELLIMSKLCETISNKFDQKIVSFDQNYIDYVTDQTYSLSSYFIEQPILNHDYTILSQCLKNVQFSPKDMRKFQMRKQSQIFGRDLIIDSPVHKYKKGEFQMSDHLIQIQSSEHIIQQKNEDNEIDFLTWMTVGGKHNYKQKQKIERILPKKNSKIKTLPKNSIKQINRLYEEYSSMNY